MKKTVFTLALVFVILLMNVVPVYAESPRSSFTPNLTFSGTTANCSVKIKQTGKTISATLDLWYGSICVASWHDTDISQLVISETIGVGHGKTYTLTVYGTIDGVPFSGGSVTKTCP